MSGRIIAAGSVVLGALMSAGPAYAQSTGQEPAGGAAIGEAVGATAGALVATALVVVLIRGHRNGSIGVLNSFGTWAERQTGLPAWASVPSILLGHLAARGRARHVLGHLPAHRQRPRPGAARQPRALPDPRRPLRRARWPASCRSRWPAPSGPPKTAIHLGGDWWAPVGGLMMAACGAFALTGFPLDDMWHRLFGQDVTLWGPTHLMLIGGASLATLGGMVLMGEAITAIGPRPRARGHALDLPRAPRAARGRLPRRALDLPGRVRLRRAAVPRGLPADPDHARRRHRARHFAPLHRARRRCSWPWPATSSSAASSRSWSAASGVRRRLTSRSTSSRRCSSRRCSRGRAAAARW